MAKTRGGHRKRDLVLQRRVGQRIKDLREARGLKRRALGRLSGIAADALADLERGASESRLGTLSLIARAMGVKLRELLPDELPPAPPPPLVGGSKVIAQIVKRLRRHEDDQVFLKRIERLVREVELVAVDARRSRRA